MSKIVIFHDSCGGVGREGWIFDGGRAWSSVTEVSLGCRTSFYLLEVFMYDIHAYCLRAVSLRCNAICLLDQEAWVLASRR